MFTESDVLELKSEMVPDVKKELIAFANTKGGTLYIGIGDDGQVHGLTCEAEKVIEQISSMIHDGIKPDLTLFTDISVETIENKSVIKISVQRGTKRPYYLTNKGLKPSGVYIRLGNTSIPSTETAIRAMIVETDGNSFEAMRSTVQDLTFHAAQVEFQKHGLEFKDAQKKSLGLLDKDGIYSNLGLLLSDQCQHSIKMAVFKGTEKEEFLTRKEFSGSLFTQITDAYSFIELNNHVQSSFEGLYRIDRKDYSDIAIREALLNAIIHRDYSFSGSTLISVFPDRLEMVTLGGLVDGLALEDIFEGVSQTRNEKLSNIFYRLEFIEAYGTGIRKIKKACKVYGISPIFNATNAAFRIVIPNANSPIEMPVIVHHPNPTDTLLETVAAYIYEHGTVSRKSVQEALGLKQTKCGLILKSLEEKGSIEKSGQGKNTYYQYKNKPSR